MIITYLLGKELADITVQYEASRRVVPKLVETQKESVLIELERSDNIYYPVRSLLLSMVDEEDTVIMMGECWVESDIEQYNWTKYQLGKKGCTLLCIEAVADEAEIETVE